MGQTILLMEKYFLELHTVEIKKEFLDQVKNNYKGNKIQFHLDDSGIVLKDLYCTITSDAILFFGQSLVWW